VKNSFGLAIIFSAITLSVSAQDNFVVKKDLKSAWMIFDGEQFTPHAGRPTSTIYLMDDLNRFGGDHLVISSSESFSLFLNGKLLADAVVTVKFPVDSLRLLTGLKQPLLAIHRQSTVADDLSTQVIAELKTSLENADEIVKLTDTGYSNFMIAATIFLCVFLLFIVRFNPHLATGYFSIAEFFSLRESEDHPMFSRITNTTNILAYIFASLLVAKVLLLIPFESIFFSGSTMTPDQFGGWLKRWMELSALIMLGFIIKALVIYLFSALFNFRDLAGFHYFNFVKFHLLVYGIFFLLILVQFFSTGSHSLDGITARGVVQYASTAWIVIAFLKLLNKSGHTAIHLFLYICATEIIPFLIIIKVL
jgi:hypothetical protein